MAVSIELRKKEQYRRDGSGYFQNDPGGSPRKRMLKLLKLLQWVK